MIGTVIKSYWFAFSVPQNLPSHENLTQISSIKQWKQSAFTMQIRMKHKLVLFAKTQEKKKTQPFQNPVQIYTTVN